MTVTIEIPDAFVARAQAAGQDPILLIHETLVDLYAEGAEDSDGLIITSSSGFPNPLSQVDYDRMTPELRQSITDALADLDAGFPAHPARWCLRNYAPS